MLTEPILLIVDLNAARLEATEKVLREAGFQTIEAHNAATARDACRQNHPAAAIVYVSNSADENAALIAEIKGISPPVSILQISPDAEINADDCDIFLAEPFDQRSLLRSVKTLVKLSRTQIELQSQKHRLDALTAALSNVVWTNKAENSTLALVQAFKEFSGKSNGDGNSHDLFELVHPEDKEQFDFERAHDLLEPFHSQYRLRGTDGEYKKFKVYGVPVFNHDGSLREWVGTINDATAEQMAQDELSQQVALFQLSFEPIFAWDFDGGIVYWNNGCEQLYGYSIGEALGKESHQLLKSKHEVAFEEYKKTLETTGRWSGIVYHTLKNGRTLIVESRQMLRKIGGKRLVLEANRDVTEHHLAEEKLRASEERYRAFIKQSSEGIWRFELDEPVSVNLSIEEQLKLAYERGYIAECNEAMARMYGFDSAEEIVGARLSDLFADDAANEAYLRSFIESGYLLSEAESHEKDASGKDVYFANNLVGIVENNFLIRVWGTQRDVTALKESEKVLARYGLISAQARDIVLMLRTDGGIVEANAAASRIYGYSIEELLTKNISDLRSPESLKMLPEQLEKANLEGILFETIHRRRDGSDFDVEVNAVGADIGGERFILSIIRDITERRNSEESLRQSAERLKLATDTAAFGTWDYDLVRGDLVWSENQFKIFGYEPCKPDFEMFDRGVHPDDYQMVVESIKKSELERAPYKLEYRIFRADTGELRWLSVNGRFFYDEKGAAIRFIGASLDITESKNNEERIKRANERFHIAEEASNGFLYDWNAVTNFVERSAAFGKVLGYKPNELSSDATQWADLIHPKDIEKAREKFNESLKNEENYSIEYRVKHKNGHYIHIIDKGLIIRDESGKTIRVVGTVVDISEIKQAQLKLQKSEERFRLLTENLNNIFWIYDWEKKRLEYLSPAFETVVGIKPETLFSGSRKWAEIIHPEDSWQADTAFLNIDQTGAYDIEYRIVLPTGKIRWLRDKALPVNDENGALTQIVGVAEDITERREIEDALRENREQLRLSTEAARLAPWSWKIGENEFNLAPHHVKLWGMIDPKFSLTFEEWAERVHPEDREEALLKVEKAKNNHSQYDSEYRIVPLDGTEVRWIRSVGQFVYDAEGKAIQLHGVDYDITERKNAEEALLAVERHASEQYQELLSRIVPLAQTLGTARELETVYRAIKDFVLSSMPCMGFFVSFYDGARNLRTPAYCWGEGAEIDISGLPPVPLTENGGPNSQAVFTRQTIVVNNYHESFKTRPHVLTGDDNGIIPKSSIAVPMIVMGRIIGTIEVQASENNSFEREHIIALEMASNLAAAAIENVRLLDIEATARQEAELANRSKDEFLAVLSHELRTPLNSMFGWVRMLSTGQLDAEKTRRAVEVIERNINLQTKLIEDILDVSRIISGKIRLENRQIDFLPLINSVIELTQPTAETKNVELVAEFNSEACIVTGDAERLQQVVNNLLTNAIKFTPAGGKITVKLDCNEERAEFKVIDTGIGIEPEFLPYVFERFRQADSSSKRKHGGLGLGLAIVKHLIEMHGGEVSADSAGVGQGATFTIRLPMQSRIKQIEEKLAQIVEVKDADLKNLKLLIVDDDTDALEMLKTVLSAHGASVTIASSAIEALKILENDLPDVLISDIGMPEMNGMEMIGKIRESNDKKLSAVRAIAVTAYASTEDRERILASGFNLYQHKPVNFIELVKNIKKAAER